MDFFFDEAAVAKKRRAHFNRFMVDVHARIHAERQRAAEARTGLEEGHRYACVCAFERRRDPRRRLRDRAGAVPGRAVALRPASSTRAVRTSATIEIPCMYALRMPPTCTAIIEIEGRSNSGTQKLKTENVQLQAEIARKLGYKLVDHRLELYCVPLDDDKS